MDDREYFTRLFETIHPKLRFPNDKRALNAWQVYEPSFFTQVLTSEQNRQLYAEAFDFTSDEVDVKQKKSDDQPEVVVTAVDEKLAQPLPPPSDVPADGATAEGEEEPTPAPAPEAPPPVMLKTAPSLKQIVLQFMLDAYKGGAFDENVLLTDKVWIGERLNVDMPIEDIVDLDNNVFWRRVAEAKCNEQNLLEECQRDDDFDWKNLGVESKLTDIYENTTRESWDEEKLAIVSKAVSPYVFRLNIGQLIGVNENLVEKNQYNPLYKIFNYPPKDCHHGNLGAALSHLTNLQSLTLQFGMKNLQYKYELRLFEVSFKDIENLASGLLQLPNLRALAIKNSRLDDRKCKILVHGIVSCRLEKLELSGCHLEDAAGKAIGFYLQHCPTTLKELELKDNYLSGTGLLGVGYGIQEYLGELEYVGLSGNPIGESGVTALGGGFCEKEQVKRIDFSRCDIGGEGPFRLVQMIGFHKRLEWMSLSAVRIGELIGENLVTSVNDHWNLLYLDVRGCGLTENQQRKIKMILERNKYFQANACMKKPYFEEEDAKEVDEWIAKPKNPILLRVFERQPSPDRCNEYEPRKIILGSHIPTFIPETQQKVVSTSEILEINYIDCFGPDTEGNTSCVPNRLSDINDGSFINIHPNQFNQDQFNASVLIGKLSDMTSKQYFQ